MKFRRNRLKTLIGYLGFFALIAAVVTAAMLIYASVSSLSTIAVSMIMLAVILALAGLCTLVDFLRRKYTVDAPVEKILDATQRIAEGDFSVRLKTDKRLSDYNEFDLISENLNIMAEELSKNEVLKNDFISNVSHEFKTPLAVIQNYATLLMNNSADEQKRAEYAGVLCSAAKRLTALVTNILKLNKLENNSVQPVYERVKLNEMLEEAILRYEEQIERKRLEIECYLDDVSIVTSPQELEIVWNNLLSNAVKFTPDGGKITVSLKEERGFALVSVKDTGCGMSSETGSRIFDKFYQGDTSHTQEGNGLGLALVKKVIAVLGGEIFVESAPGEGSTFTVRLKCEL